MTSHDYMHMIFYKSIRLSGGKKYSKFPEIYILYMYIYNYIYIEIEAAGGRGI